MLVIMAVNPATGSRLLVIGLTRPKLDDLARGESILKVLNNAKGLAFEAFTIFSADTKQDIIRQVTESGITLSEEQIRIALREPS